MTRDDTGWRDDDADPFDRRALPRQRRTRSRRVGRVLAWTAVAAFLMVAGGVLALAVWPRVLVSAPPVASSPGDRVVATVPSAPESPATDAPQPDRPAPRDPGPAPEAGQPAPADSAAATAEPGVRIAPPPLPPLPPALEPAPPPSPAPGEATAPVEPQPPAQLPASGPRGDGGAAAPPPALPPAQAPRSSPEIMADFLVTSGDRTRAETTARTYAEWYPAGSAERRYWLAVLQAVRRRP